MGSPGVQQALLDGAAERRAVGVGVVAEVAVEGVGVGVEVDHADRALARDRPHDRQGHEMVAAGSERDHAGAVDRLEKGLDPLQGIVEVDRVAGDVAEIGAVGQLEGRNAERVVHVAHHRRHVADLARTMARAGPVGGAAVPGHADQADLDLVELGDVGQAHEGRDAREAGHDVARDRLERARPIGHEVPPRSSRALRPAPSS